MKKIGSMLSESLSKYGVGKETHAAFVCHEYNLLLRADFGERFARQVRAVMFQRNELVVEVKSSVWASQLQSQQDELLQKFQEKMRTAGAQVLVRRVRYVVRTEDAIES